MSTKTPLGSIFSTVPLTMSPARYSLNVFSYWAASDFGFERGVASCLAGGGAWVPFFGKLISVALKSFFASIDGASFGLSSGLSSVDLSKEGSVAAGSFFFFRTLLSAMVFFIKR